jgi:hypothetical protein
VKYVKGFGRFWWDFIVGDDWTVAAGVPLAVALLTGISVWRQAGQSEEA